MFVRYVLVCAKELLRYIPSRRVCILYICPRCVWYVGGALVCAEELLRYTPSRRACILYILGVRVCLICVRGAGLRGGAIAIHSL